MATQNLFEYCLEYTLSGIKSLKLCSKLEDGTPIDFPIDIVLKTGDESTILGSINESNQTITIGNQVLKYINPLPDNVSFKEEETKDRRGDYYTQTIQLQFPKLTLDNNKALKDFIFDVGGEFAVAKVVALITDNNDIDWLVGFDLPLVVDKLEITTGGNDNLYSMTLIGKSYSRIRRYENI